MEIALRVVQFWSEIKLVITNRTPASRSCDFVITRLISDQIALHSVQLPLFISSRLAMNLILCYYALGDREKMKKTFQKMLQIELSVDEDEKYTTNGV